MLVSFSSRSFALQQSNNLDFGQNFIGTQNAFESIHKQLCLPSNLIMEI